MTVMLKWDSNSDRCLYLEYILHYLALACKDHLLATIKCYMFD